MIDGVPLLCACSRCKTPRSGPVRLEGVEETSPDWAVRVELNEAGSQATVTAYQKRLAVVKGGFQGHDDDGDFDGFGRAANASRFAHRAKNKVG